MLCSSLGISLCSKFILTQNFVTISDVQFLFKPIYYSNQVFSCMFSEPGLCVNFYIYEERNLMFKCEVSC